MASATGDASSAPRTSIITVALCYMVAVFEGIDLQAAGVAAPRLGPAFGMTPEQLGWFFSSSTFGLMLGAAIGGRLSDRFGRKAVLICAVGVFGALSLLTALAPNVEGLLIARFLTGVGLGGALPNLVALVAENTAPSQKNRSVGLLYAGLPTGGAVVSLISLAGGAEDWRMVFIVGGLAPLIAIPLLMWILPDSRSQAAVRQEVERKQGFVQALFRENRALRSVLLWISFFLSLLTMYLLLNWLPTLLIGRGLSRPEASLVQVSFNVLGAMASFATGYAMDKWSLPRVIVVCFVASALALALLAGAPAELAISMAVGGLVGIAMSGTQALLYAIAPANYPTEVRGTGVGSAVAIGRLGSAVGPLLAGVLLGSGGSPAEVLGVLIPIILVAGAAALVLSLLKKGATASS